MTDMWIADEDHGTLQRAGLATFEQVMGTKAGRCLRVLPDRENWYLPGVAGSKATIPAPRHSMLATQYAVLSARVAGDCPDFCGTPAVPTYGSRGGKNGTVPFTGPTTPPPQPGLYLKKHRGRTWRTWLAAALGFTPPASPGRIEAENALALQSLGIEVMPLTAYGEKLRADGCLESFLLSEELQGYCELQDFILQRFNVSGTGRAPLCSSGRLAGRVPDTLRRLIVQVADIARLFHAAGFNHRDFYTCHFLVKETSPSQFDVRLIDLQRVQRRRWFRRRWIVKDLAQLASMSPDTHIGCRGKMLFLRTYLGVNKLRPQDKRLVRAVLKKLASIRRHSNPKRQRGELTP